MLKKGSKLNSILTGTCPKCHEESMYLEKNPYKLNDLYKCSSRSCDIHSFLCFFRNKYKKLFFRHIRFLNHFIPLGFTMVEKHLHQYVCELRSIELKEINYFLNFLRYLFQFISSDKGN